MITLKSSAALMLLGTLTLGMAATTDEQILAIQTATSTQERVALMNEFKARLAELSTEERATAIEGLRSTMKGNGEKTQAQVRVRERVRVNQMQADENMQRNQNMNQHQAASQAIGQGAAANNFMGNRK